MHLEAYMLEKMDLNKENIIDQRNNRLDVKIKESK